jgi:carbamoyl-phosphate synthase small subunit
MTAILLLEDGTTYKGKSFGAKGIHCGEVVFNTSMSGYQEILTDPSYHEQIVTMTYPMIGNYGTNSLDWESRKLFCAGFIVKENCEYPSNFRNQDSLSDYLEANGIVGLEGIDTRSLVKHIREQGAMRGIISSTEKCISVLKTMLEDYPGLIGRDIVKNVSAKRGYKWKKGVVDVVKDEELLPKT